MEALSDGHTVAPLIKVGYLHSRRGAKTYLFHFGYQTKDSEYPQVRPPFCNRPPDPVLSRSILSSTAINDGPFKRFPFHLRLVKQTKKKQRLGSVRGEDLPYIFGQPLVMGQPHFAQNFSRQDMGVAEAVLNFVTNFCKTGDPNEAGHQQVGHKLYLCRRWRSKSHTSLCGEIM